MPIPTNRQAPGLLSFFGLKNGGRFPQWGDEPLLNPTIDYLDWAMADPGVQEDVQAVVNPAPGSISVLTFGAPAAVPNGEFWGILQFSLSTGVVASGAMQLNLGWARPGQGTQIILSGPVMTPSPAQPAIAIGYVPPRGVLWISPGSSFQLVPTLNTLAASIAVVLTLRFVRAKV